jgi:hypothetical protein
MKLLALTFSLPLVLSSCGTHQIEEKQIQPVSKTVARRDLDEDIFHLAKPDLDVTYVYLITDKTGKLVFLGENKGYNSAGKNNEGIWINMKNPRTDEERPVFVINNVIISSFRLDQ